MEQKGYGIAMILKIILGLMVLIAIILGLAATKPDSFRIERSVVINADTEKIFPLINDFHRWSEWSPWEKLDPGMKRTFAGSDYGVGSVYAWEGNKKVGQGSMEITESAPTQKVQLKLDFMKPMEAHNTTVFTLNPQGDKTEVTWAMFGPSPFLSKLMTVFISMDKLVGKDFESGLANLKSLAEK